MFRNGWTGPCPHCLKQALSWRMAFLQDRLPALSNCCLLDEKSRFGGTRLKKAKRKVEKPKLMAWRLGWLIKRSFTWNDHWLETTKHNRYFNHMGKVSCGHLGALNGILIPPYPLFHFLESPKKAQLGGFQVGKPEKSKNVSHPHLPLGASPEPHPWLLQNGAFASTAARLRSTQCKGKVQGKAHKPEANFAGSLRDQIRRRKSLGAKAELKSWWIKSLRTTR